MKRKFRITFEAKQTAVIYVEAETSDKALVMAEDRWKEDGLEGKWKQSEPRITKYTPMGPPIK